MADKPGKDVRSTVQLHVSDEPVASGASAGRETKDSVVDKTNLKNTFIHVDQLFHGDDPEEAGLRKRAREFDKDRNGLLDMCELRQLLVSELKARSQVRVLKIVVAVVVIGLMVSIAAIAGLTYAIVATTKEVSVDRGSGLMMSSKGGEPLRTAVPLGSVLATATTTTTASGRRRLLATAEQELCMYNGTCPVSYTTCKQVVTWLDMLALETREVDINLDIGSSAGAGSSFIKARAKKYLRSPAPWIQAINQNPPDPAAPDEYKIECQPSALDRAAGPDCTCPIYLVGKLLSNPTLAQDLSKQNESPAGRRLLGATPATASELQLGTHTLLPAAALPCSSAQEMLQHHQAAGHARVVLPDPVFGHVLPVSMRVAGSAYTLDPATGTNTSLMHLKLSLLPLGYPKLPDVFLGCPAHHVPHHFGTLQHSAAASPGTAANDTCTCHVYLNAGASDGDGDAGVVPLSPALLAAVIGAAGAESDDVMQAEGRRLLQTKGGCTNYGGSSTLRAYDSYRPCYDASWDPKGFPECTQSVDDGKGHVCQNLCQCSPDGTTNKYNLVLQKGYWDPEKKSDCFPAGTPVLLAAGGAKPVEALVPGDMLAVVQRDGSVAAAPFAFYSHKDAQAHARYHKVVTEGGRALHLSSGHLLPASLTAHFADSNLVVPLQLTARHFVFVVEGAALKAEQVASVSVVRMAGLYAPHAASADATIVVGDGMVASEYTTALPLAVAKAVRSFFLAVYSAINAFGAAWAYHLIHDVAFHGFMAKPMLVRTTLDAVWTAWGLAEIAVSSVVSAIV